MPPKFRTRTSAAAVAESPERLFDDLPRIAHGPEALWAHQADVLRSYFNDHLSTPDVALELPTGAGKTLPGLLIAEWRRRKLRERVLYACPTQQLAHQTAKAAENAGIDCITLVGRHHDWSTADKVRYESGQVFAVTTYSTVFNAVPAVEPAATLLFDDAHAAEQFVAGSFSVDVNRVKHPAVYEQMLSILRPALSGIAYERLQEDSEDAYRPTVLVGVEFVRRFARDLSSVLRNLNKSQPLYWSGEMLGDQLDRCLIYVASDAILIRPFIPPTGTHRQFTAPSQRIYLSATLGEGGELERAFGRTPITRLAIPEGWDTRGAGRRLFVFADLQKGGSPRALTRRVIEAAGKGLVLSPTTKTAEQAVDLLPAGSEMMGPGGAIGPLLDNFRADTSAVLSLAARYDGLDLPHSQCRVTVLNGMPRGAHLQERFISQTLVAGRVLRERQRTRVIQGAGRCTRGLSDHSIVVVLGDDVNRFLNLPDVFDALRPELQAEISFGLDNSEVERDDLMEIIESFLKQDSFWRDEAEPDLLERRKESVRAVPPENAQLAAAAKIEVKATAALWSGDWAAASQLALDVAGAVSLPSLAAYRALWMYLASAWLKAAGEVLSNFVLERTSLDLLRKAHVAARGTSWLREVAPLPADERTLDDLDEFAVQRANEHGPRTLPGARWATLHTTMLNDLSQTEAKSFERGLAVLGGLLGAEAYKPAGEGRTDSAWIWDDMWWLAVEAKTEEQGDAPVSQATIRQVNDQLKTLSFDRSVEAPVGSAVVIVSARTLVDPTAAVVAEPFVHLTSLAAVRSLAADAVAAWKQVRAQGSGASAEDAESIIRRVLAEYQVLPSDVRGRLLANPVHG